MPETDRPTPAPLPEAHEARLRALLEARVAQVIEEVPGALELLVTHGFTPLATPAMRRVLAPTVTLRQALRLRSLPAWREEAVLRGVAELAAAASPRSEARATERGAVPCR